MEVRITFNGKPFRPGDFRSAIEKDLIEHIEADFRERLAHVNCRTHHGAPRLIGEGRSLSNLTWRVEGCCEELIEAATKALE